MIPELIIFVSRGITVYSVLFSALSTVQTLVVVNHASEELHCLEIVLLLLLLLPLLLLLLLLRLLLLLLPLLLLLFIVRYRLCDKMNYTDVLARSH